jgi:hypothetical protein
MSFYEHFFWNYVAFQRKPWAWKVGLGGVMPDVIYMAIFLPKLLTYESFGAWMRDPLWDVAWNSLAARSAHSFVVWGIVFFLIWLAGRQTPIWDQTFPFVIGWGLHVAADALTHVSDGYAIFYPLSNYRFPAPISYWERAYHAREYFIVSHSLMAGILLFWLSRWLIRVVKQRHQKGLGAPLSGPVDSPDPDSV